MANLRHAALLEQARDGDRRGRGPRPRPGSRKNSSSPIIHDARGCFDEITGARPQDEVLRTIFERFCIGK